MKKNDENQNNDSGMTRRVYKKASLDDTVVNVRKDPSDDFDLLSDDGMMDYVPGVDDVDHFDFDEKDIVIAIEDADDSDIKFFTPTPKEEENYRKIYDKLLLEMSKKYEDSVQPIKDYNKEKIDNWFKIQIDQISLKMQDLQKEIENLLIEESMSSNRYEKEDILKKAAEKKKQLDKQQDGIGEKVKALKREADRTIEEFNAQYDINPVILVNIVLKF